MKDYKMPKRIYRIILFLYELTIIPSLIKAIDEVYAGEFDNPDDYYDNKYEVMSQMIGDEMNWSLIQHK